MSNSILNGMSTLEITSKIILHRLCPGQLRLRLAVELPAYKILQAKQAMFDTRMSPGEMMRGIAFVESIAVDIRAGNVTPAQITKRVGFQAKQHGIHLDARAIRDLVSAITSLPH
jgi:hypothetical protein